MSQRDGVEIVNRFRFYKLLQFRQYQTSQTTVFNASECSQTRTIKVRSKLIFSHPFFDPALTSRSDAVSGFSSFPQHQNTREASSSWFELALVRPPPPCRPRSSSSSTTAMPGALPSFPIAPSPGPPAAPPAQLPYLSVVSRIRLYSNLHANREFTPYSITIERGEEEGLIEMMEPGDRLVLYAMAQYPAWTNVVRECAIQIDMRAL